MGTAERVPPALPLTGESVGGDFTVSILEQLNGSSESLEVIRGILEGLKRATGLEAVAIRLHEGEDYPYFATRGFPASFIEAESSLCAKRDGQVARDRDGLPALACMCGNVIRGRTDPELPFFTEGGSFWSNGTSELLATTSEEDRRSSTRNRCNSEGYESVALVPLRASGETTGLLQMNDPRPGCFTPDFIQSMERLGNSVGIAVTRSRAGELQREADRLQALVETAGAAAHEINQPLQAITGQCERLLMRRGPEADQKRRIEKILAAAERISEIVMRMKTVRRYSTRPYWDQHQIVDFRRAAEHEINA